MSNDLIVKRLGLPEALEIPSGLTSAERQNYAKCIWSFRAHFSTWDKKSQEAFINCLPTLKEILKEVYPKSLTSLEELMNQFHS